MRRVDSFLSALSSPRTFWLPVWLLSIRSLSLPSYLCGEHPNSPNILKIRGLSQDFIDVGANSFIVLDRLYQTLTDKISYWKERRDNGFVNFFDFRGKKQKAFLAERLAVGFDIASALEYLHDRK